LDGDDSVMATSTPTHYDVLGISRDADAHEVRRAWKTLVSVWHPDRFSGAEVDAAQERAAAINDAYSTLRDTSRRSAYDCRLAADERQREIESEARVAALRAAKRTTSGRAPQFGSPAVAGGHGAQVAAAVPFDQQLQGAVHDVMTTVRRHPRASIAVAAACVLALVGIGVFNAVTGPSLPVGTTLTHSARVAAQGDNLADLAASSRQQATAATEALDQQIAADAAAQAAARTQPVQPLAEAPTVAAPQAAQPAANPAAAAPTARSAGKVQEIVKPDGTHVLRIMPG
jgi:DnaJ-domain-containing protein 1